MALVLQDTAGLLVLAGATAFMLLVTPWERIKKLIWFGLVGGLGLALALIFVMQNVFGYWVFLPSVDLVFVAGMPLLISAGWIPVVIAFAHLLAQYRSWALVLLILLAFPAVAVFIHLALLANGMLIYNNWTLPLTYAVALALHAALLVYLYFTGRLDNLKSLITT